MPSPKIVLQHHISTGHRNEARRKNGSTAEVDPYRRLDGAIAAGSNPIAMAAGIARYIFATRSAAC